MLECKKCLKTKTESKFTGKKPNKWRKMHAKASICISCQKKLKRAGEQKKRENDPIYRMQLTARSRVKNYLKINGLVKDQSSIKFIGCTPEELAKHLESQFKDGMTWDNYGKWEIDHIYPISKAKTLEDVKRLSHYKNLQPLWAKDNREKSNKIAAKYGNLTPPI